jgi:hypothetical protein
VHAVADVQDTPLSSPLPGAGWIFQVAPFHRSARSKDLPLALVYEPTAVQAVDDEQDTALSWLEAGPTGLGAACTDQAPVLRSSISG